MSEESPEFDKLKNLLLKIKELSERGVNGEKESAEKKLHELLNKYDLELTDIEIKDKFKRTFRIKNREDYITVLSHVIWSVSPKVNIKENTRKLEVYCSLTNEHYIEVCERFDYYWSLWCSDKTQMLMAYIVKNGLTVSDVKTKHNDELIKGVRNKMDSVTKGEYVNKKQKLLK